MSASLVGSEMCIRDSSLPLTSKHTEWAQALSLWANDIAFAPSCAGACAVSYTHLTLPTICSV
eukprot:1037499-Alexandrium_andersonii.AAC.1